jgi:hypothetical protein
MGVFKKLKDVLFDVEEEEIPVITKEEPKEEPKVIEKNPIKEIKIPKDDFEKEEVKKSSSFNFPMDDFDEPRTRSKKSYDFDDDDFGLRKNVSNNDLHRNSASEQPKRNYVDYSKFLHEEPKKEEVKTFTPTPIISPVYGILDQNYTKDDVIVKTDIGVKGPDLDEVRKKAYGLDNKKKDTKEKKESKKEDAEDEFTEPIRTLDEILMEKDNVKPKEEPIVPEKDDNSVVTKTTTVNTVSYNEEVEYVKPDEKVEDDELPDEPYADEEPVPKKKVNTDDTLETDLFNLIDSMYEEKSDNDTERDEE